MFAKRVTVQITTDASGNATVFTPDVLTGRVINVIYTPDGTIPFANTAAFTITGEDSGLSILTVSSVAAGFTYATRQPTHSQAGVAALYAAAGTAVNDYVYLTAERIKTVLSGGGNAKTGQVTFVVA